MSAAALAEAAGRGDRAGVLDLLATMDDKAKRAACRPLDAARKALTRADPHDVRDALTLAALGCRVTAAEAAKALIGMWRRQRESWQWPGPQLEVFAGRDPAWLADAGRRVAAAVPVRRPNDWTLSGHPSVNIYRLARWLLWMADVEPETSDGFVVEWALTKWRQTPERTPADVVRTKWDEASDPVVEAFRADPYTAVLLPAAFGVTGFGTFLAHPWHWRADLLSLTETGELDRATLLDRCVDGLVRGGRVVEIRGFQKLLDEARPTEDEEAERAHDWAGLAGRAAMPTAGHAVESLRRLLDAGRLDIGLLTETSYAVLIRPEKTLVRTYLKLLAEALRRDPKDAADLLPAIATAFGHDDTTVQEQAWKLTARHLATAGDTARAQLRDALPQLTPDLRDRAATVLGVEFPAEDVAPSPVVVSTPRPTAPSPSSVEEAVQEIAALLAARTPTALEQERAVDGLIRAAYLDRAALAELLAPVIRRQDWIPAGLSQLLGAVRGKVAVEDVPADPGDMSGYSDHKNCIPCTYDYLLRARWYEAARRLLTEPVPFLLATPGWSTGALDAAVLVERLTEYARLGLAAGPTDLDQALLRVRLPEPPERDALAAVAAGLGSADGARLARWLNTGGVHAGRKPGDSNVSLPALRDGFTVAFQHLDNRLKALRHDSFGFRPAALDELVVLLPVFREYLAEQLTQHDGRHAYLNQYLADLPLLVEADGPAGPQLNTVLACAIGATDGYARPAVVEALLQASARGDLDERWCGEQLGRWTSDPFCHVNVEPLLVEVARAGYHRLVWNVLHPMLPAVLALPDRPRKLGDLLRLAADCATHVGATGDLPGLDELADSPGTAQAVRQAQRLRHILDVNSVPGSGPG